MECTREELADGFNLECVATRAPKASLTPERAIAASPASLVLSPTAGLRAGLVCSRVSVHPGRHGELLHDEEFQHAH